MRSDAFLVGREAERRRHLERLEAAICRSNHRCASGLKLSAQLNAVRLDFRQPIGPFVELPMVPVERKPVHGDDVHGVKRSQLRASRQPAKSQWERLSLGSDPYCETPTVTYDPMRESSARTPIS
jgi:hypothetical protein